jgi:hypothetical protein
MKIIVRALYVSIALPQWEVVESVKDTVGLFISDAAYCGK